MIADTESPQRWIVVAEAPFIPTQRGGEREHRGFVEAAVKRGLVSALVVPTDPDPSAVGRDDDLSAMSRLVRPAPLLTVPRRRSSVRALTSRLPYVVASRPAPPGLVERIRIAAPDATAVIIFSYKSHELGRVVAQGLGLPAVLRPHNLEGQYHRSLAAAASPPRSWAVWIEALRIEADERRLERSSWLTGIADISIADATVRSRRATVPVEYVPPFALGNRATGPAKPRQPAGGWDVVFLGALDVSTNQDAIEWFAAHVWPKVRAGMPQARWLIVGRNPAAAVRGLAERTEGAELHPDVPDPSAYLQSASVAVNPAVSGSGVNIKLVDYLAAGIPVVSSTRGMVGLGLVPSDDLLVANSPAEFAAHVVSLLASPEAGARLGARGQAKALQILNVDASLRALIRLLAGQNNRGNLKDIRRLSSVASSDDGESL